LTGQNGCSKFDRHRLGGHFKWLARLYTASVHKLIHRFLWISQTALHAEVTGDIRCPVGAMQKLARRGGLA
jgi:hypothetical protein